MTVDIARMDNNAIVALDGASDGLARLAEWVQAARNAHQLVSPLIGTPFVPDAYKPKVDPRATDEQKVEAHGIAVANATAAVLQGITLGIDPLMALQQIYIVHGRPGLYAKMMVALVQSRGHEVWTVEGECTDTRAVVYGRRKGSQNTERVIITMDIARKAGWTSNQAYTKTPADMLWNRAAARVCDRIASDVLKGIASVEEIQDSIQTTAEVGTRTVTPRTRNRPAAITADEEPSLDETPAPAPHTSPSDPSSTRGDQQAPDSNVAAQGQAGINSEQRAELTRLLKAAGRNGRTAAAKHISSLIDRDIDAATDLTEAEATKVIDALETEVRENTAANDPEPSLLDEPA